jgi:DNA-binding transcriptional MerR regulator
MTTHAMATDSPTLLTVREAAERLEVTARTLKYYEEMGLVVPTRSEGRYRLYTEDDIARFARIFRLRSLGFSLQAITEMLKRPLEALDDGRQGYSTKSMTQIKEALEEQLQGLDSRIESVRRELAEARKLRAELGSDLDYLNRRIAGESRDSLVSERLAARKAAPASPSTRRKR